MFNTVLKVLISQITKHLYSHMKIIESQATDQKLEHYKQKYTLKCEGKTNNYLLPHRLLDFR